jgi:hypothetical protein
VIFVEYVNILRKKTMDKAVAEKIKEGKKKGGGRVNESRK